MSQFAILYEDRFTAPRARMNPRMDAAGAVDAQNAPTAPWKTAQHAVSHSAHTDHRFQGEGRTELTSSTRLTHEIPDTPADAVPLP